MSNQYYILNDLRQKKGPFKKDELIGRIKPSSLVWTEGMDDWQKASTIKELEDVLRKSPPPVVNISVHQNRIKALTNDAISYIGDNRKNLVIISLKLIILLTFFFTIYGGPWVVSFNFQKEKLVDQFIADNLARKIELEEQFKKQQQEAIQLHEQNIAETKALENRLSLIDTNNLSYKQKIDYIMDKVALETRKANNSIRSDPYRMVQSLGVNLNYYKKTRLTEEYDSDVLNYNKLNHKWIYSGYIPEASDIANYVNSNYTVNESYSSIDKAVNQTMLLTILSTPISLLLLFFLNKFPRTLYKELIQLGLYMSGVYLLFISILAIL